MDNKEWHKLIQELKKELKKELREEIKSTVNGKIDRMNKKFDDHLNEIDPFLQGWRGGKMLGNAIKWLAGLVIAIGGAIAVVMNIK